MADDDQRPAMHRHLEEFGPLRYACTTAAELIEQALLHLGSSGAPREVQVAARRWALAEVERQLINAEIDEMQAEVFLAEREPDDDT